MGTKYSSAKQYFAYYMNYLALRTSIHRNLSITNAPKVHILPIPAQ